ncbi:hypothetical protein Syun_003699 [Stephania yunnanensis]|uniref:Caffeoyl-CoA O-methyltransferase n=1 Tax=Stephania yunnanensis TaxID=152371 RepID=A0AAP0L385_9MAGN
MRRRAETEISSSSSSSYSISSSSSSSSDIREFFNGDRIVFDFFFFIFFIGFVFFIVASQQPPSPKEQGPASSSISSSSSSSSDSCSSSSRRDRRFAETTGTPSRSARRGIRDQSAEEGIATDRRVATAVFAEITGTRSTNSSSSSSSSSSSNYSCDFSYNCTTSFSISSSSSSSTDSSSSSSRRNRRLRRNNRDSIKIRNNRESRSKRRRRHRNGGHTSSSSSSNYNWEVAIFRLIGDEFDFVFVDADKPNYIKYHEILVKLVKVGGLIGYDNTLWFKCVALPDEEVPEYMMENRNALKELNSYLASDARIEISNIMHLVWDAGAGRRLHTFEGHESPVYSVSLTIKIIFRYFLSMIDFIFSTALDGKIKAWLYDCLGSRVDYDAPGLWCTTMAYSAN